MTTSVTPLAIWHDGTWAILWRRTPKGRQFLTAMCALPREARQDILHRAVTEMAAAGPSVNLDSNGNMASVLLIPLAKMSPWAAEMPPENIIGFGPGFDQDVPVVPPEYAVLVEAAMIVQKAVTA